MGAALLGRRKGEKVEIETPGGVWTVKITDINW